MKHLWKKLLVIPWVLPWKLYLQIYLDNTVLEDDYFVVQIGIPENDPDEELKSMEVDMTLPETFTASNAQKQTVKNTEDGLTTLEIYTANNIEVNANSTNSTIVVCSETDGTKTIKPQRSLKLKCKYDKMYIDYISDNDDYSTFVNCEEATISDEWL